jgi:hypothetical protein
MPVGWQEEEWLDILDCKTLADLVPIACRVIDRLPGPVALVSGPISTGGILKPGTQEADIKANLVVLNHAVEGFSKGGISLFNQMPFEDIFVPVNEAWKAANPGKYCMPLLEEFYRGIFEYERFRGIILLPGWESSFGANWEYKTICKLKKEIVHLPVKWNEVPAEEVIVHIATKLSRGKKK